MTNTNPLEHFSSLEDYRDIRYTKHSLLNLVAISICAIICGAKDWYDVEDYAEIKVDWLRTFLNIGERTPSHDTFKRFFSYVDAESLEKCFSSWVASIADITEGRIIHIDGKTLCGSKGTNDKYFVHMVSAWCSTNGLVLGQQKVDEKSNEITAIPALLELLVVKGCVITIDAMGCQQDIAKAIVEKQADYILAVKDNQKFLHQDIQEAFAHDSAVAVHTSKEVGHGRIETRTTSIITDLDWICKTANWASLYCIIKVFSIREDKRTGQKQEACRYYISSKKADAAWYHQAIRLHWSIENQLHWVLDVCFSEDSSKKQDAFSAQNFSLLNKVVLNMLRHYEVPHYKGAKKISMKRKRNMAGWSNDILLDMLFKTK